MSRNIVARGRPLSPTRFGRHPFENNPPEQEVANPEMCLLPVCSWVTRQPEGTQAPSARRWDRETRLDAARAGHRNTKPWRMIGTPVLWIVRHAILEAYCAITIRCRDRTHETTDGIMFARQRRGPEENYGPGIISARAVPRPFAGGGPVLYSLPQMTTCKTVGATGERGSLRYGRPIGQRDIHIANSADACGDFGRFIYS